MAGAILIVIVLVIAIPVAVLMGTALIAVALGWSLKEDAEARHAGSELVALNR
jgi:hypothetical protein